MRLLFDILGFLYLLVIIGLALFGLNSLIIAFLYIRDKAHFKTRMKSKPPRKWPSVTIQLPIYNERYTVKRLLEAVTSLDYPSKRLQIQVLDDSTDDTAQLVNKLVKKCKSKGVNIICLHRTDRTGFKAGALRDALDSATGDLIAIFDADFVPKHDWLLKTVPMFQDEKLGCLQTRWGHINRKYNSLTQVEGMAIDGHFVVEQTVRSGSDLFLNFNGTAGLWRRTCIDDAGGWQYDTLTEDLDLSYRAQMRGWKIGYLPNVVVPAELPSQVEAFKKQQFRWAKGSFQVVRKILPQVFEQRDLPWNVRFMAILHLTGYFVHPLMLASLILTLPVGLFIPVAFKIFPFSVLTGLGPPLLYLVASAPHTPPLRERLKQLPLMIFTGFGISLSTSIAVLQGLTKMGGDFIRTPKLNLGNRLKELKNIDRKYLPSVSPVVWGEIALGIYAMITILVLTPYIGWGIAPWMMIYVIGYFYIAGLNLIQHMPRRKDGTTRFFAG